MEEWKDIPGIENYMASSCGLIKNKKTDRISYGWMSTWGYKIATIYVDGKKHGVAIHNLIATAFIGEIRQGFVVNHKDGNKLNNNVGNLEICTVSENNKHAYRTGLKLATKMFGIKNGKHRNHVKAE